MNRPTAHGVHVTCGARQGLLAAVVQLLAKAIGIPKSRLELVRGETSREKLFRVLG